MAVTAGKEQIMKIIYVILDTTATVADFTVDTVKSAGRKLSWWFYPNKRYDLGLGIGYVLQFLAGFAIGYVVTTAIKVVLAILALS